LGLALGGIAAAFALVSGAAAHTRAARSKSLINPMVSEWQFISSDAKPPGQQACNAIHRRCFTPESMANSYDYAGLHAGQIDGRGKTIAIIDSFGTTTIRQDLGTFDTQFGLPHLCGETGPSTPAGNCPKSVSPRFDIVCFQGCPPPAPAPPTASGATNAQTTKSYPGSTYQEAHNGWALEVSLDVEWAHATAPGANIMLVTTPTAETLGVQGFQQMMNAETYVINNHMADVITQSFGAGEGSFHDGYAALKQLRQTFIDAEANHVSVFASSGDGGTTNTYKEPVKNPAPIPYPSVIWPASDPLVTSVGGTYLCTNAETGVGVDNVSPPANCDGQPNREVGWVDAGGGYSILFPRPDYQNVLPPGSTFVGSSVGAPGPNTNMRGVPDVAYQASSRTGVLVRLTERYPPGSSSTGSNVGDSGWWVVGGTSSGSPQWAGIAAMADQAAGHDLGFLNPALYAIASADPSAFYDVTTGCNQTSPIPGYCARRGWDEVTGLGTPDVAELVKDLTAY
jgi:subtilase family serine protease